MDDAKQQLIDRITKANNILVTVSRDPSVDQLASCIGLTLMLNKQGKHAAAVFSGKVPSTLEFLQPDATLEKNTDSLRDFIISLDKSKADKLRYKVEEDVVRIFITPYKTSLSQDDLEFSEGDFNVDVVVALGVSRQEDLDEAITAHGRILHDATVTSINTNADAGVGSINWNDPQASSLSELVTDLVQAIEPEMLDEQIATALLTGIVSETERFSNDKTSSQTMSASAALMAAGANQQLVASKLEEGGSAPSGGAAPVSGDEPNPDGELDIDHTNDAEPPAEPEPEPKPSPVPSDSAVPPEAPPVPAPVQNDGQTPEPTAPTPPAPGPAEPPSAQASTLSPGAKMITEPPQLGGTLTANTRSEPLDPVTDPMSLPQREESKLFSPPPKAWTPPAPAPAPTPAPAPPAPAPEPPAPAAPQPPEPKKFDNKSTLTEIEKSVDSPHLTGSGKSDLEAVRNEVSEALGNQDSNEPIQALNAQPLGGELHGEPQPPVPPAAPAAGQDAPTDQPKDDSGSPPPVPPPIPFQFGNPPPASE